MKKQILLIGFLCFSAFAYAQNTLLSGTLSDTLISKTIPFASVSLLDSDSNLIESQRTNFKGIFEFENAPMDSGILLIAHPKYLTTARKINSNTKKLNVYLLQKKQLLRKVVIQDRKAIVIKGDTISFTADSFATRQGDVVEDLLKLLPGMQVDENGNIVSQGAKVEKVLVNGEEFFGTDPTIATKNLPSKAIEKVEVYDYKDEQESFTGFTKDEEKTKVINLKLKKEMNKGGFAKAELHGGWEDRWRQKLMINRFRDKEQVGAYYLANSNQMANLDWDEGKDFGNSTSYMSDGNYYTTMTYNGDGMGNPFWGGAQYGITKSWRAGARYANKFEKKNQELRVNYSFLRATRDRNYRRFTENLTPGASFDKIDSSTQRSLSNGHNINARYKTDLDSLTSLSFNTNITTRNNITSNKSDYYNATSDALPISFNNRTSNGESRNSSIDNTINLKKKFLKKGRTISLRLNQKQSKTKASFLNKSRNAFDLINDATEFILDQENRRDNTNNNLSTNLVYTEPLSEKLKLKLSYNYNYNVSDNQNIISDTVGFSEGTYQNQLDSLSNIFESNRKTHRPGFELRYQYDKWRITLRNSVSLNNFIQNDLLRDNNFNFTQTNIIPGLSVRYKITKYRTARFSYSGNTSNPRPNQIQPFPDITNPLNIIIGNPNLRMSYNQRIRLGYNSYSPLEGSNIWVSLTGRNAINRIGTSRTFDQTGRTITTYINLPNSYGLNSNIYLGKKISSTLFKIGASINGNYAYNPNVINEISGYSESVNLQVNPRFSYMNKDLLGISFRPEFSWNSNRNKGNLNREVNYFEFSPNIGIDLWLPNFFVITTKIQYDYTPAVEPYNTPFTRLFGTGKIKKRILKDRSLELLFTVNDIFNQNKGYHRESNINYNTESFYNTLGRYWMIGASWSIFKGPGMDGRKANTEITGTGWSKKLKKQKEAKEKAKKVNL